MTLLEQTSMPATGVEAPSRRSRPRQGVNVNKGERTASVAAGVILAALGLSRRSVPGLLVGLAGGALIQRGVTGHCGAYSALGLTSTTGTLDEDIAARGVQVREAFLINRPAEELYRHWRNFENLPRLLNHLESVRVLDAKRSHWVARAPKFAGGRVEWDAEVVQDEPNHLIAWRSLPGGGLETVGEIRFERAIGDRGTEVHASLRYVPPAGKVGDLIAKMLGRSPAREVREGLRNFKRLMETGDVLTIQGQPRGTCGGQGVRASDELY